MVFRFISIISLISAGWVISSCSPSSSISPDPTTPLSPNSPLAENIALQEPVAEPAVIPTATLAVPAVPASPDTPAVSIQKILPLSYHHTARHGVTLSLVGYDDRNFTLNVADQKNGPATHWETAHAAASANRGVAAINGGFFTPQGKPLGLVITHGERRGGINRSSLGTGIYLHSEMGSRIIRRKTYTTSPHRWGSISHLLQSGPMLVDHQNPVAGLSKKSQRPRSFLVWDGRHHWAIGYASPCTLAELSKALAGTSPAGFTIHHAMNLDGGRSSDLWVGSKVKNGSHTHRGFLNKPVRNFLVITPR